MYAKLLQQERSHKYVALMIDVFDALHSFVFCRFVLSLFTRVFISFPSLWVFILNTNKQTNKNPFFLRIENNLSVWSFFRGKQRKCLICLFATSFSLDSTWSSHSIFFHFFPLLQQDLSPLAASHPPPFFFSPLLPTLSPPLPPSTLSFPPPSPLFSPAACGVGLAPGAGRWLCN